MLLIIKQKKVKKIYQDLISNIIIYLLIRKNYNSKKLKSISPKTGRNDCINRLFIDRNNNKIKSQTNRSKSKNKSFYNRSHNNTINNLNTNKNINKKNNNINKNKTFKKKMRNILSKNIIALTKNKRNSSFINKIINKSQNTNLENIKNNNIIYSNGISKNKNKNNNPSPNSFRISNNNNNNKFVFSINNNQNNYDIKKMLSIKRIIRNKQKFSGNQNYTEYSDNSSSMRTNERIYSQSSYNSYNKKKKDFSSKYIDIYNGKNNGMTKIQKTKNTKINIININKKKINKKASKYDEHYKKYKNNAQNSFTDNMNQNNKNLILNDIRKKYNLMLNNLKIKSYPNEKKMTIIQNFSKYKKKGTLNIKSNKNIKINNFHHN